MTFTRFSLLILLLISAFFAQAQKTILFDATKAEMANNADWIIDSDSQSGGQSNPQRYPTPSQSGITSSTNESYWKGAISAWAVDAVKKGFHVETLPKYGDITYGSSSNQQDLSNYDIFVVCEPNILFTYSEKQALMHFVENGGGLFMVSDHNNSDRNGDGHDSPEIWNDFMDNNGIDNNPFGISFDYEFFTEQTYNIPNLPSDPLLHGPMGGVTKVEFYGGTSLTLSPSANNTVKGVVFRGGYSTAGNDGVLCAYAKYGQGRVVALGDSSPADDGTGDTGDNLYDGYFEDANGNHQRLIINATIWLGEDANAIEDLSVTDFQVILTPNPTSDLLTIQANKTVQSITLSNTLGQIVFTQDTNQPIDVSSCPKGIYTVQVKSKTQTITKTVVFE